MLSFFETFSNYLYNLWRLIWNSFQLLIDGFQIVFTMSGYMNTLILYLPSVIALSVSLVVGICVLRFMLLK